MSLHTYSNVGIGTTNPAPAFKLSVNGTIRAKEVIVQTGWSDFVFERNYKLEPLINVEKYNKDHGHLKDIPSAIEIETDGLKIAYVMPKMLMKIEEQTLYQIELQKKLNILEEENSNLKKRLEKIELLMSKVKKK